MKTTKTVMCYCKPFEDLPPDVYECKVMPYDFVMIYKPNAGVYTGTYKLDAATITRIKNANHMDTI